MTRIVDLSKEIYDNPNDPFFMRVKIKHKAHAKSTGLIRFFVGLPKKFFPKQWQGWADDKITQMGVHSTTHIDVPWHYAPEVAGKPAKKVEELPLEWCYGDGICLDLSHKKEMEMITLADIQKAEQEAKVSIQPGNIVLIKTGRDQYVGTKEYAAMGTGMGAEATEYLIDKGVKVMGIDQWGWDLPLKAAAKLAKESGDDSFFWQGHLVGREKEYCHMEQLVNLGALPPSGYKVAVFPLKIRGASAAPARVVAIFDEE